MKINKKLLIIKVHLFKKYKIKIKEKKMIINGKIIKI